MRALNSHLVSAVHGTLQPHVQIQVLRPQIQVPSSSKVRA